ncbi:MAG: hypothetical protein JXR77_12395 [Lentisphaeria bacterium]|nr:hypothetical protein [Lentisphaeria bacterium]
MGICAAGEFRVVHPEGEWEACHAAARVDGPRRIEVLGGEVVRDVSIYVDDVAGELLLPDRVRSLRKGGCAVVQTRGHYPFGSEVGVSQSFRYAANHVQVTTDLHWPSRAPVVRHLGVGGFFLPGRWLRFYCVPPCLHLAEGSLPRWHPIPSQAAGSGMAGHWHRPPCALVFEREDGVRLEVGTGCDGWRWERNMGFGPEAGSYKVLQQEDGIRVVREPLMTCAEVVPAARDYRFTWYLAWSSGPPALGEDFPDPVVPAGGERGEPPRSAAFEAREPLSLLLDFGQLEWAPSACRVPSAEAYGRGCRLPAPCWHSRGVQKQARRIIRRLAALPAPGWLTVRGFAPGVCWDPAHCDRTGGPLPHWDLDALLDFAVWTRQQLGPEWRIRAEAPGWESLPSVSGLFAVNGFRADRDEPTDG